jgi:hypothetical protein
MAFRYVQKDARHADARTTGLYVHEEDERWHDEAQKLRMPWLGKDLGQVSRDAGPDALVSRLEALGKSPEQSRCLAPLVKTLEEQLTRDELTSLFGLPSRTS